MLAYCVLALGHIIYLLSIGTTSDAWNSVAEVVALTINSSPTQSLHNTCSGIYGTRPFRTMVRIVATAPESGRSSDHLELVFDEGSEGAKRSPRVRVKFDEEYGCYHPTTQCD